jgi:hypothetical protein
MAKVIAILTAMQLACAGHGYSEELAGHYMDHLYVRNATFPPDCVELAADSPRSDTFYSNPPKRRPANVPKSYVLVRVFQGEKFLGWGYMNAQAVNFLHGSPAGQEVRQNN